MKNTLRFWAAISLAVMFQLTTLGCRVTRDNEASDPKYWSRQWHEGGKEERIAALRWFAKHLSQSDIPKVQVEKLLGVGELGRHGDFWHGEFFYIESTSGTMLIVRYKKLSSIDVVESAAFIAAER